MRAGAPAVAVLAAITIIVGNVGALGQSSLKRMLAYSSVAQAGYMLAGVVVATSWARRRRCSTWRCTCMNMAAFAMILARERETSLGDSIAGMRGLARERPLLAWPMTLAMLGLAGIPATAGFMGKFYLIDASISGGYTWLGVVIVIGSMISLGYYLPVVAAMWMSEAPSPEDSDTGSQSISPTPAPIPAEGALPTLAGGSQELDEPTSAVTAPQSEVALVAIVAGAAILFFGIVPQPLFNLVHGVGSSLGLL